MNRRAQVKAEGRWDEVADKTHELLGRVVRKAAFDIEAQAKTGAPVDLGALRNSIHTITDEGSNYGAAALAALTANPQIPIAPLPVTVDDNEAVVGVGVGYAALVEHGTTRSPAQPFLGPAVETVMPVFEEAVGIAVRKGAQR